MWVNWRAEEGWQAYVEGWKEEQRLLASKRTEEKLSEIPRLVAGVDAAFSPDQTRVIAAAIVWDRQANQILESVHHVSPAGVPYVPGYLSFREGPAVLGAVRKLTHPFDLVCFDGQGYAHPRRCGIAVHMGVLLGVKAIGVGKSRLIGTYSTLPKTKGAQSPLMDHNEVIGQVLRTKDGCNPVFVSPGHRIDLPSAVRVVEACLTRYRLPEPTRLADIEVARVKRELVF